MYDNGWVQVLADRATAFFVDDPLRIDYDEEGHVFRIRANTHVIPDRIKL